MPKHVKVESVRIVKVQLLEDEFGVLIFALRMMAQGFVGEEHELHPLNVPMGDRETARDIYQALCSGH
jgi:hypothetical protein